IEPTLAALAPQQFEPGFAQRAAETLRAQLGVDVAASQLAATWAQPLDFGALYARCVLAVFRELAQREFDRTLARWHEGESAPELIRRWGFHALDITPCADGRLAGVTDFILRVPPAGG
ncbi:MAG: carboxysome shell carbonic anhydrase, partial [Geminicoccaceae bacterium]|nr:carboxysome shell carbonic anhydrase [Geminicoccaceae bacterium]